ncbi:MAG TPA: hypothetical protein VF810_02965 [Patescibacteria group bacterium]
MKRPTWIIIFILVTIMGLAIAQVSMANQISTTGAELANLQSQVDDYKKANIFLKEQLLQASAFTTISEEAKKLGFMEAKTEISLTAEPALALKQ